MNGTTLTAERDLIEAAKRDPQAFALLYDRYVDRIYRYAFHLTGTQADAEDVTAQTFLRALEYLPRYEWRAVPFGAWLYRTASNCATDLYRQKRRTCLFEEGSLEQPDTPDMGEALIAHDRAAALLAEVRRLPPIQRDVILLRFGAGLANRDVARILHRSEGAVRQLQHRGLVSLRTALPPEVCAA